MTLSFDPNSLSVPKGHFIAGKFVEIGRADHEVRRPSDGQLLGTIAEGGEEAVDRAVQSARWALGSSGWGNVAPRERGKILKRWADIVEQHSEELAQLESVGSSRPIAQTRLGDSISLAETIRYYAEFCDKLHDESPATRKGVLSVVRAEPYGVIGAIAPWNFPFLTAAWKFAPALAAGNAVVLKVSELTPFSTLRVAQLGVEAGLPSGLLNVVNGRGATGEEIVRHPGIAKIAFTGSSATGARIMAEAAAHGVKPVSLELGGKSPMLICPDVQAEVAAQRIAAGILPNSGQVCTASSRIILPNCIAERTLEILCDVFGKVIPGHTWDEAAGFAPLISLDHAARVDRLVKETVSAGAKVLAGGSQVETNLGGAFYAPTILDGVTEDMAGYQSEFFGPVISVHRYDDFEEALELCDHPIYGLAASIHTNDLRLAHTAANAIEAGTVWVNRHGRDAEFGFPQGGFKASGNGRDMGRQGIEAYRRHKSIWIEYER